MKKIFVIGIVLIVVFNLVGCGEKSNSRDSGKSQSESQKQTTSSNVSKKKEKIENGSVIFSTEYKIEDYHDGYFVVSKSDGLLYGVFDLQGKEIIPVKYDDIELKYSKTYVEGDKQSVYFELEYEGEKGLYDVDGNKLFDMSVEVIPYEIGVPDDDSPYFVEYYNEQGKYVCDLYTKNGDFLCSIERAGYTNDLVWVCPNRILDVGWNGVYLYNAQGEVLGDWEDMSDIRETSYSATDRGEGIENGVYYRYLKRNFDYYKLMINEDGDVSWGEAEDKVAVGQFIMDRRNGGILLGEDSEFKLYQSNETWKYEDSEGNPIYDERYYTNDLRDESYFLSNEDKQICVIAPNGKKIIDYGYIIMSDKDYFFDKIQLSEQNFFSDFNSACIVKVDNGISDVYYFGNDDIGYSKTNKKTNSSKNETVSKKNAQNSDTESMKKTNRAEDTQQKISDNSMDESDDDTDRETYNVKYDENGKFHSIEDYANSEEMQDSIQASLDSLEGSGMHFETRGEGNRLYFTYIFDEILKEESMVTEIKNGLESQETTFRNVATDLKDVVNVDNPIVVVEYVDADGELIYSQEFTAY